MTSNKYWNYRTATEDDINFIVDLHNENRVKFKTYFPAISHEYVRLGIVQQKESVNHICYILEYGNNRIGYVWLEKSMRVNVPIVLCLAIQVTHRYGKRRAVLGLQKLVIVAQNWAAMTNFRTVQYETHTGNWKTFQKLLERMGSRQIGVIMERSL